MKVLAPISAGLAFIPGLNVVGAVASAIFAGTGKIAQIFGWSKPTDPEYSTLVTQTIERYMANANGDTKSKTLALDAQNTTDIPHEVFGTTEDEMAIQNIVRRPMLLDKFIWTNAKGTGGLLWKWPVIPTATINAIVEIQEPSRRSQLSFSNFLSYTSSLAHFWRGGIIYDFNAIKTNFHSGRLAVYWLPGGDLDTDLSTIDRSRLYKEVFDLRSLSEFSITVPYTSNTPWMSLARTDTGDVPKYTPTGLIFVEVLNALRSPSSVANQIEFLVSVSGAPDFQLAYPFLPFQRHLVPASIGVPTPGFTGNAQGIMYPTTTDMTFDANCVTMGEAFLSLRQILKRFTPWSPSGGEAWQVYEDVIPSFNVDRSAHVVQTAFGWVGALYRYKAGSLGVLIVNAGPYTDPIRKFSIAPADIRDTFRIDDSSITPISATSVALEPIIPLRVPFYQITPAIPTTVGNLTTSNNDFSSVPTNPGTTLHQFTAGGGRTLFRNAGDDFSFGKLIAPPVIGFIIPPDTVTTAVLQQSDNRGEDVTGTILD